LGSDLLWSDPDDITGFKESPRGAGFLFGEVFIYEFRISQINLIEQTV